MKKKRLFSRKKTCPILLVFPVAIIFILISVYPLVYSLTLSFYKWYLYIPGSPKFIGLANFKTILIDGRFWGALRNTIVFVLVAVSMEFIIGLGLAILLAGEDKAIKVVRLFLIIPMMITPVVIGQIWRFMYNDEIGIINYLLSIVGIKGPVWLGDISTALFAIIVVDIWQWTPFMFLVLLAGIMGLPQEVIEAARVDGATESQIIGHIMIPLLKPVIGVVLLIRIIDTFKIFDKIYVLTRGGPANTTETLSMYTYKVGFNFFHMGYASALSYVILIIIVVVTKIFLSRVEVI